MARRKKESYYSITLDGVTMLRPKDIGRKNRLVFKIATSMSTKSFERWKVKYSQQIEAFKSDPEAVILTVKDVTENDNEGTQELRQLLGEYNNKGELIPLTESEYKKVYYTNVTADGLIKLLQDRHGLFSDYVLKSVKLMNVYDHLVNIEIMKEKFNRKGVR